MSRVLLTIWAAKFPAFYRGMFHAFHSLHSEKSFGTRSGWRIDAKFASGLWLAIAYKCRE